MVLHSSVYLKQVIKIFEVMTLQLLRWTPIPVGVEHKSNKRFWRKQAQKELIH